MHTNVPFLASKDEIEGFITADECYRQASTLTGVGVNMFQQLLDSHVIDDVGNELYALNIGDTYRNQLSSLPNNLKQWLHSLQQIGSTDEGQFLLRRSPLKKLLLEPESPESPDKKRKCLDDGSRAVARVKLDLARWNVVINNQTPNEKPEDDGGPADPSKLQEDKGKKKRALLHPGADCMVCLYIMLCCYCCRRRFCYSCLFLFCYVWHCATIRSTN